MTYASEAVRHEFHQLPVPIQFLYVKAEEIYLIAGLAMEIVAVSRTPLKVTVQVTDKLKDLTSNVVV